LLSLTRRIDRLARSTFDLFAIVKRIVDAKAHLRCGALSSQRSTEMGVLVPLPELSEA
jgi:DNA invertase Pin-like site-specific DNA recombinase